MNNIPLSYYREGDIIPYIIQFTQSDLDCGGLRCGYGGIIRTGLFTSGESLVASIVSR